jgi:hypothetical protein
MNGVLRKMSDFVDTKMFIVTSIHQAVIILIHPSKWMTLSESSLPLIMACSVLADQLSVQFGIHNPSITLIKAETRLFERAPAFFAKVWHPPDSGRSKETFINFNHSK